MQESRRDRPRGAALAAAVAVASLAIFGSQVLAQEETCPQPGFRPQLLTPMSGRHPRDAGLVIGLVPGGTARTLAPVVLTRRRREVQMVPQQLAPGLFRVTPDARRIYGRYRLSGVAGDPEVIFGRVAATAAPPAPRLERVERYLVASASGERIEVRAHFQFPVPEGVVAIVAFWGEDNTPDLYARAVPTQTEAVIFQQTGNCVALPEGATPPPETGPARVAFVDRLGQVSGLSEPRPLGR